MQIYNLCNLGEFCLELAQVVECESRCHRGVACQIGARAHDTAGQSSCIHASRYVGGKPVPHHDCILRQYAKAGSRPLQKACVWLAQLPQFLASGDFHAT